jgi:hypothetical protein
MSRLPSENSPNEGSGGFNRALSSLSKADLINDASEQFCAAACDLIAASNSSDK